MSLSTAAKLRRFAFKDEQVTFRHGNLLWHDFLHVQVLNLVPLFRPTVLHVTFVRTFLQWINDTLPAHIGGTIVGNVGNEIVFVGDYIGETRGDQIQSGVQQILLFNGRVSNMTATESTECVFEFLNLFCGERRQPWCKYRSRCERNPGMIIKNRTKLDKAGNARSFSALPRLSVARAVRLLAVVHSP